MSQARSWVIQRKMISLKNLWLGRAQFPHMSFSAPIIKVDGQLPVIGIMYFHLKASFMTSFGKFTNIWKKLINTKPFEITILDQNGLMSWLIATPTFIKAWILTLNLLEPLILKIKKLEAAIKGVEKQLFHVTRAYFSAYISYSDNLKNSYHARKEKNQIAAYAASHPTLGFVGSGLVTLVRALPDEVYKSKSSSNATHIHSFDNCLSTALGGIVLYRSQRCQIDDPNA